MNDQDKIIYDCHSTPNEYIINMINNILENKSINSDEISEYFKSKPLKRYIQFNENISNSAPHIFFNDYSRIIEIIMNTAMSANETYLFSSPTMYVSVYSQK
jgi:hypothetical protein